MNSEKKKWLLFGRGEALEAIHFAAASLRIQSADLTDQAEYADGEGQWERKKAAEALSATNEKHARRLEELHHWLTS